MYTVLQFSPTGNAAYVAELLAKELNVEKVHALEHTDPTTLDKNNHLILFYAIHAFSAPRTVKRFIRNLPEGKFDYISLIGVGCNTGWVNLAASKDIKKCLEKKSYKIVVDKVVAMPLTLVMSFPETLIDEQIESVKSTVIEISENIKKNIVTSHPIPFKSNMIHSVGHLESGAARLFGLELHAKKSCIKCGLCVKECPEHNIRMNDKGKIKFGLKCMLCMRCIYNCPTHSITPRISKFIPIKGGYSIDEHIKRNM